MSFWVAGSVVVGSAIAADAAGDAADKAAGANKASLGFEERKYADWEAVYGPIQQNLSKYYQKMTPENYAIQGVTQFNKENQAQLEKLNQSLAQRGMLNSGTAAAVTLASGLNAAEQKATIRATADEAVAAEQGRFLQIGLGQNPGASYSQVLAQQASRASADAAYASGQAGQAIESAITTIGTGLSDYSKKKNPTQDVGTINTGNQYANIS